MIKIRLAAVPGYSTEVVRAVRVGWFAIHHKGNFQDDFVPEFWRVTHIPSGRLVGWFYTADKAKDFAEWLNSLKIDWRRLYSRKDVKSHIPKRLQQEIKSKVRFEYIPLSYRTLR